MHIVLVIGRDTAAAQALYESLSAQRGLELSILVEEGALRDHPWAASLSLVGCRERLPSRKQLPAWVGGLIARWYTLPFRAPATLSALQLVALRERWGPAGFERLLWLLDALLADPFRQAQRIYAAEPEIARRLATLNTAGALSAELIPYAPIEPSP